MATDLSQPIQHLVSHLIGGARAQIVMKIFGPDLPELQRLGKEVHAQVNEVPGVVDQTLNSKTLIPQFRIMPDSQDCISFLKEFNS